MALGILLLSLRGVQKRVKLIQGFERVRRVDGPTRRSIIGHRVSTVSQCGKLERRKVVG